jgi:hypothetical protein
MTYQVTSHRLAWPSGTVLSVSELTGCNIELLVATGHLTPASTPKKKAKWEPEQPVTDDDPAEQPKE